ncbi:SWIM zinc finger domain-containing protein [Candidatus Binatia bacterium]|nr:SWIM zinc finger domain-containing protein [Candidatus Binatia bacterium]
MTNEELAKRQDRAVRETYVITQAQGGFRVYAPTDPKRAYRVTGSAEQPSCTCPDFGLHAADPTWRCKHILAVLGQQEAGNGAAAKTDPVEAEERRAIQEESRAPRKRKAVGGNSNGNGATSRAHMLVKRSVSPDGRIDSLSVEFSAPLDNLADDAVRDRAQQLIALQSSIVGGFLSRREAPPATRAVPQPNGPTPRPTPVASANGDQAVSLGVPAQLLNVAGMDGKWGRRLFINVQVNGKTLKLFGKPEELAAAVAAAGFNGVEIQEGTNLNLPCRVITKPSPDGKYTNVDRVLPANGQRQPSRSWS